MTNAIVVAILAGLTIFVAPSLIRNQSALPSPSGPYAIGTLAASIERTARTGAYPIEVWYPAQATSDRAPYSTGRHGLIDAVIARLLLTRASRNAPPLAGTTRFPIVFYLAGWNGLRFENTALCENLASHGFAVIALDDVTHETPSLPALAGPLDLSSDSAYASTLVRAARKLRYSSNRVSDILDRLLTSGSPVPADLARRLDETRIAAMGYSFGGAIAYDVARTDARFRAAINLDGWLFTDHHRVTTGRHVPYLLIGASEEMVPLHTHSVSPDPLIRNTTILDDGDWSLQRRLLERGGASVQVSGATHSSFADNVPHAIIRRKLATIDPDRLARIVSRYSLAFLDRELDIDGRRMTDLSATHDSEVWYASWPVADIVQRGHRSPKGRNVGT